MNIEDFNEFQRQNNQQYQNLYTQIEIDDTTDSLRGIGNQANQLSHKNKNKNKKKKSVPVKKQETFLGVVLNSIKSGFINGFITVGVAMFLNMFKKQPQQLLY